MRELQLYPAKRRRLADVVCKLQFIANGSELAAWVIEDRQIAGTSPTGTESLFVCAVASGASHRVEWSEFVDNFGGPSSPPVFSSDGRYLVTAMDFEEEDVGLLYVEDRHSPTKRLPEIQTTPLCGGSLFFTPDGGALIAVRNDSWHRVDARNVARFEVSQLAAPPKRFRMQLNPFTRERAQVPVWNFKWKQLLARPRWRRVSAAALSANGRFLAVCDITGDYHIADLKAKRVIASFPPEGKKLRHVAASRIDFDPTTKWVVRCAGRKLFARPLKEGKAWQTKPTLGNVSDFAFHPGGHMLCAVFADGQACYLDAITGAVKQSFRWSKKPKPLYSVAFAPDGLTCAAGGENGRVVIWDVDL